MKLSQEFLGKSATISRHTKVEGEILDCQMPLQSPVRLKVNVLVVS